MLLERNPVKSAKFHEAFKAKQIIISDLRAVHYEAVKKLVDFQLIANSGLRFAHDPLFGVGAGCFDELFFFEPMLAKPPGEKIIANRLSGRDIQSFFGERIGTRKRDEKRICIGKDGKLSFGLS